MDFLESNQPADSVDAPARQPKSNLTRLRARFEASELLNFGVSPII